MRQQFHESSRTGRFIESSIMFLMILSCSLGGTVLLARYKPQNPPSANQSTSDDGSELIISSTEQFLLTAPDGKEAGFDRISKTVVQSIPRSSYATEGLAADDDSGRAEPPSYSLDIYQPSQGTYHLKIFGGEKRNKFGATISVVLQDGAMPPGVRLVGSISSKSTEDYEFKLSTSPGSKLVVTQTKTPR